MSQQEGRSVVVVGGGFAGVTLARRLERRMPREWNIYLLSRENYITYNPLLAEVVGASILPGHVVAPVRQMVRRTCFRMVDVTGADLDRREVRYRDGREGRVAYDHLVLACGVRANPGMVPGMAEHAFPFNLLGDALSLRNRILMELERAELEDDPRRRRLRTTFIVVGGGFSGVELAAEINDFVGKVNRYYPGVERGDCRVALVHGADRLLGEISPTLGDYTARKMRRAGVDVRVNARVARVNAEGVELQSGERIEGLNVISTIGTAPRALIQSLALPMAKGRVRTDPDMSVPAHPGVWAIGDCAAVVNAYDGRTCPPTAQFAVQQARQLADNITRGVSGEATRPFRYRPRGQLASIGRNKAVAELFGIRLHGFIAWLLWRGFYLLHIPTLGRKVRVFLEWNWEMLFPPDIVHLRFTRTPYLPAEQADIERPAPEERRAQDE